MFSNAITCDLSEPDYRALPRWSVSQLKLLPHRPELFYGQHVVRSMPFDTTAGMLFGTACHAAFLEGQECHPIPPEVLTSNGQRRGKAWEEYKANASPLDCLSGKEMSAIGGIRHSIQSQPKIANLLWGQGFSEFGIEAEHQETGLPVKSRLDKIRVQKDSRILCDLKITSIDPDDERAVSKHVLAMGYHRALAFYADMMTALFGDDPAGIILVIARATQPFTARMWSPNANDIDLGRRLNRLALRDLANRLESNLWSGERHDSISYFSFPDYAYDTNTFVGDELEEFATYSGENQ